MPPQQRRGQAGRSATDTHPHDHHLHGHVFGEADRGPEVRGQRHKEVEDGHQVLPVNCLWGGGKQEPL